MSTNPETHQLTITRALAAPRELVWQAWTDPTHLRGWLSLGEGSTVESVQADLRVGGRFRLQQRMPDGEYYTAAGTYLEVTPPDRLVYTWDWEQDGAGPDYGPLEGQETLITIELTPNGDGTQFTLTHQRFLTTQKRDNHIVGWNQWLDRMAAHLKA